MFSKMARPNFIAQKLFFHIITDYCDDALIRHSASHSVISTEVTNILMMHSFTTHSAYGGHSSGQH